MFPDACLFPDSGLFPDACQPADICTPGCPVFPLKRLSPQIRDRCLYPVLLPRKGTGPGLRADQFTLNRLFLFRGSQHARLLPIGEGSAHI